MLRSLLTHLARLCLSTGLINGRGRHRDQQEQIRPWATPVPAGCPSQHTLTPWRQPSPNSHSPVKEPAHTLCVRQALLTLRRHQGKITVGFAIHPAPSTSHLTRARFSLGFPRHKPSHTPADSLWQNSRAALQMLAVSTAPSV